MKLLIMQSSPVSGHFLPLRFTYPLSTLFSNTLNLCSSLSVTVQVSHPHNTRGKILQGSDVLSNHQKQGLFNNKMEHVVHKKQEN